MGPPPVEPVAPLTGFLRDCADLGLSPDECGLWSAVVLPEALPPSHGNRHADDEAAARLGLELFFDLEALSSANIRCVACHAPERGFTINAPMARGRELLQRNSLALVNAARVYPHFWDGRADSMWSQALLAIENPDEMAGNRLAIVHRLGVTYRAQYEAAFGALPDFTDAARFPPAGRPGTPAWAAMSEPDRHAVTAVFVNVGKALEAYVRRLSSGRSKVDRFILGQSDALQDAAKEGLRVFTRSGCLGCHSGAALSDGRFHALDVPLPADAEARAKSEADRGREQGVEALLLSDFNASSEWYERAPGETLPMVEDVSLARRKGFRTPSLRNVVDTGPYGHNGVFATLDEVVSFHLAGGGPECVELEPRSLTAAERASLLEFLRALKGDPADAPWPYWP